MQQPPNRYPQQQWQQPPIPAQQQWNPQEPPFPPQQDEQTPYPRQPPYNYPPQVPPPKNTGKGTIGTHIGGVAIALAVIVVLGVIVAVIVGVASGASNSAPEQLSYATPTIGNGKCDGTCSTWSATQEPSTPTSKPTSQPTKGLVVTHGTPHIGGPISDFYGKYGQPNNQGIGNSETWIVDQQQQILVNATPNASGEVTGVTVTSGANWSDSQTKTYCSQFLPSDASEFNSISNLTDYHSSIGEIVLQLEPASCVITIAGQ